MLRELRIKNFAIVDSLTVEFHPGLNILSGETGAGKSVIIGALALLLGGKANNDMVRSGAETAEVQALFDPVDIPVLEDMGIEVQDGLIIRRSVSMNGKGKAYVNDSLTSIKKLEELGRDLVDIHGQHDHQRLMASQNQLRYIDTFGKLDDLANTYREMYREHDRLLRELRETSERTRERGQRTDLLRFQVNEIESSGIYDGEIAELEERRKILFNSAKLRELCETSYAVMYDQEGSVIDNVNTVLSNLKTIEEYDSAAGEPMELLGSAEPLLSDVASLLRGLREKYDADPGELNDVEARLDTIRGLQKKYGKTEEEILNYAGSAREELNELEGLDERTDELRSSVEQLEAELKKTSGQLSEKRRKAATQIEKQVSEKLKDLAFKKARFEVELGTRLDDTGQPQLGPAGIDDVEFLFSANVNEPAKPLKRVASGGELSRVMLAIKSVFAMIDDIPLMVFDEIDAGIGGNTAISVGDSLKGLAKGHQVICITHLAQIASNADVHYCIEKEQREKRVRIDVKLVEGDERIREIARMLSGKVTDTSIKHSEELLSK